MPKYIKWTDQQKQFLIDNYASRGLSFCVESLGLPRNKVKSKIEVLSLKTQFNSVKVAYGFRWCSGCKTEHPLDRFSKDGVNLRRQCKDYCNKVNKNWAKNNQERINANHRRLVKLYRQNPKWKAVQNLRRRLLFVLAGKRKAAHSLELIGCTPNELRAHLERQFTVGMTWDNYGVKGWHIDHRKPCAAFDMSDPKQQRECFHYTNLQPLWAKDNLTKGSS